MENTVLYVYAMTNDSGFAPCVTKDLLTLACCKGGKKGGMRKSAGESKKNGNDVWVLGLCGKTLARKYKKEDYAPVYLAKITDVIEMTEYYKEDSVYQNRKDGNAYKLEDGKLVSNKKNNPHNYSQNEIERDIGGKYVLLSDNFVYWGDKCGTSGSEKIMEDFKYLFKTDPNRGKSGIDKHYRGHMVETHFAEFVEKVREWGWFPSQKAKILSTKTISGEYLQSETESSKTHCSHGGRKS